MCIYIYRYINTIKCTIHMNINLEKKIKNCLFVCKKKKIIKKLKRNKNNFDTIGK